MTRPVWPSSAATSNAVRPAASRTAMVPAAPCTRRRRATASSPRLAAAWSFLDPSFPHRAPAARRARAASRRPASTASRSGVLPSRPAASMDDDEAVEAEAGLPRSSSLRTSSWPAAAAAWSAPLASRSAAMRHSPAAAALSRGSRAVLEEHLDDVGASKPDGEVEQRKP
jgi:hypothetical protein